MREAPREPLRGPAAFEASGNEAAQAQAAILLAIGAQLRGDRAALQAKSAAAAAPTDLWHREILDEFPIPRLQPPGRRIPAGEIVRKRRATRERRPEALPELADEVFVTQSTTAAAALAEAALAHPDELVRVAAAHAALAVTTHPQEPYHVLVEGTKSDDELVRDVAATALARYRPDDPALRALTVEPGPPGEGHAETSTMVHGTWAANGNWWRPDGDFWSYVFQNVWNDLYAQPDFYRWSGGYSAGARDQAADLLVAWMNGHGAGAPNELSLLAHSHGCSAVMLASWRNVTFDEVVLLSSPVHQATYNMNFAAVQKVVSVRVKLDLVLLADGSGGQFGDPRYDEHVLPVWFNHGHARPRRLAEARRRGLALGTSSGRVA